MEGENEQQISQAELENLIKNSEVINGYALIENLSSGPMGKTFKCIKDSKFYVIKIISENNSKNAKRQIEALKKLKNKQFIVKIVDSFVHNKQFCFVTEYFEGQSLFTFIRSQKEKKIEPHQALVIFRYILSGVLELHELHILHRNIKVENILISSDGIAKICGLGICRELDEDSMTWSLCGTPSYLAPEILLGQPYNYKSDIWSLGVLLFAMTTGQLPFGSSTSKKALYQKVKQAILPTFSFNNVKKNLKYPERLNFGEQNKDWENLFRIFFEERPSKRITYDQLIQNNLISPVLTVELPNIFNKKFEQLDEMLSSVQYNYSNDDQDDQSDTTSTTSENRIIEEQDMQSMLQSKMLVSKIIFENTNTNFTEHVKVYNFEIYKYLILIDSYTYFQQNRFFVTLSPSERQLMYYFLTQQILYYALWIEHILLKKKNQFKLSNFEAFTHSPTYQAMAKHVSEDCRKFEDEFEKSYQQVKEINADKKLPEQIQSAIIEYIYIDFKNIEYQKLPDFFKLPYRAVLMSCFQKGYLKAQRFLNFQEKVEDLMKEGKNDRDKKREFSLKEGLTYLKFSLRLLICSLINRVIQNQSCTLKEIKYINKGQFDLGTFLNSLTLANLRQTSTTINDLFKQYFPQFNLTNLAKEKFM